MEIYNHFEYGKTLAIRLKPIAHTPEKPRFFTAFGLEDLYNFNDKLSSVSGMILIAVDGCESESKRNEADALNNNDMFSFIVAQNTVSDRPETINQAAKECKAVAKQIRNCILQDPDISEHIADTIQFNGMGPIGDNFYGVVLTFSLAQPETYFIDQTYWED